METKIIKAVFGGGRYAVTTKRTRTDYGQVLEFVGVDLPDTFECIFSNSNTSAGVGKKMIGSDQQVLIPDEYLATGQTIYAWVLVHDSGDDGRHMYNVKIPVDDMPDLSPEEPTPVEQSVISQAITALNTSVDTTTQKSQEASDSADRAEHAAEGVEGYAERAEAAQNASESARDIALEAKVSAQASAATASEKASEAISSATTASQSAITAESASESAQEYATASAVSASASAVSASQAESYASGAGIYASDAQTHSQTASQKASEAAQSASTATQAKTDAESAKTASQTAQGLAESARDEAAQSASEAAASAQQAAESARTLTVDATPTQGSTNAVQSGGVYEALAGIADDVDDLTGKINAVVAAESTSEVVSVDVSGLQRVTGKKINTNNNLIDASASYSVVWVQVPFTGNITAVSSKTSQYTARIYNNITDSADITSTNFAQQLQKPTGQSDTRIGTVTAGQYLVCQAWDDAYTISATVETESGESYTLKQDIGLTEQMESEVDAKIDASVSGGISSAINSVNETLYTNNGWKRLPADDFELGGWTSYTGKDSRNYRVRCTKVLSFDRDICILADAGFYAEIIKSDGTDPGANTTIVVPANTDFRLFVRRINEDSSETANIAEFVSALNISTPLAGMEKYADTFTDLSMFPRIGICGDSYAAGGGIISGIRPLTWGKNLERQIGSTVDIYAKSGESIVGWNSDTTNGLPALLSGEECGLYWMAHGINGTGSDESIGTSADMSATPHPATFYGQYVEAIEQIKTAFPDAKIILQTITGTSYSLYQASQYTKVNTAIRAIAEYCEIPVIDVADDDLYKSTWYANSMRSNHPTAMLNAGIAHANRRLFAKCVMDNADYFVNYGNKYE